MTERNEDPAEGAFGRSRLHFETVLAFLESDEATGLSHGQLEDHLQAAGRELLRQLVQDHLDLRTHNETRLETVVDADGVPRKAVEAGYERALTTVFGQVEVRRLAYRRKGRPNLHPADAALNLPAER